MQISRDRGYWIEGNPTYQEQAVCRNRLSHIDGTPGCELHKWKVLNIQCWLTLFLLPVFLSCFFLYMGTLTMTTSSPNPVLTILIRNGLVLLPNGNLLPSVTHQHWTTTPHQSTWTIGMQWSKQYVLTYGAVLCPCTTGFPPMSRLKHISAQSGGGAKQQPKQFCAAFPVSQTALTETPCSTSTTAALKAGRCSDYKMLVSFLAMCVLIQLLSGRRFMWLLGDSQKTQWYSPNNLMFVHTEQCGTALC